MSIHLRRAFVANTISPDLQQNILAIQKRVAINSDLVIHAFRLGNGQRAAIIYVDNLIDKDAINRDLLAPLLQAEQRPHWSACDLAEEVVRLGEVNTLNDLQQGLDEVLQGKTLLLVDGEMQALGISAVSFPQRGVGEPETDVVLRGPREGFLESVRMNMALMRRKIHHADFAVESLKIGRYSQTDVALIYIDSIVNQELLAEIKRRLAKIDIDGVLDSGYIMQLIEDAPFSIFPTIALTEKPDIAAARILEGRVAIFVDGSPIALTAPMLFVEGLQSSEDYYTRFYYASFVRMIRGLAFLITIYLPAFFLAAVCFHPQVIPAQLLLSLVAAESVTPFSVGLSLVMIWLIYSILNEAGIRLPKPAGQAVSIVGAIVMGDAAVSAGLISAPILIVLAVTVISSFVTVAYVDAANILRMVFLLLAWILGFFGLLLGTLLLLIYLCSLRSFGMPFFSPFAPVSAAGLKDSLWRFPLWMLDLRPWGLSRNRRRQGRHNKPGQDGGPVD